MFILPNAEEPREASTCNTINMIGYKDRWIIILTTVTTSKFEQELVQSEINVHQKVLRWLHLECWKFESIAPQVNESEKSRSRHSNHAGLEEKAAQMCWGNVTAMDRRAHWEQNKHQQARSFGSDSCSWEPGARGLSTTSRDSQQSSDVAPTLGCNATC